MSNSRFIKSFIAFLCTSLVLSIVPPNMGVLVYADTTNEGEFSTTDYSYRSIENYSFSTEINTISQWAGHRNLEMTFTNTSDETIHDWYFTFDFCYEIENPYNCYVVEHNLNLYTIGNNDWNQDILPGQSVTVGFTASSNDGSEIVTMPSFFLLNTTTVFLTSDVLSYRFEEYSNWTTGFSGALIFTNNSDNQIRDWTITFNSNRPLLQADAAILSSDADGIYTITNDGSNQNINASQTYRIELQGGENDVSAPLALTNLEIRVKILALTLDEDSDNNGILDVLEVNFEGNIPVVTPTPIETDTPTPTITETPTPTITGIPYDIDYDTDTDSDLIPDDLEPYYGTDKNIADSDGDGIPDGYELMADLDPANPDTDGNSIEDGDEDFDGDGISNRTEILIGSNFIAKDSDFDGLNDYEEIYTYGTSPIDWDSDDDGISDYDEVQMSLDPNSSDSNGNGIPDSEERIFQTKTVELNDITHPVGVVSVTVEAEISGCITTNTLIEDSYYEGCVTSLIDGDIGVPVDITTSGTFDEAQLIFKYDENILGDTQIEYLAICWIDYDNGQIVPLESIINEDTCTVSTTVTHFSQYVLMDMQKYWNMWCDNIIQAIQYKNTTPSSQHYDFVVACQLSASTTMEEREQEWTAIRKMVMELKPGDRITVFAFGGGSTIDSPVYVAYGDDIASKNHLLDETVNDWDDGSGKSLGSKASMYYAFRAAALHYGWCYDDGSNNSRQFVLFTNGESTSDVSYALDYAEYASFDINVVMVGNRNVSTMAAFYQPTGGLSIQVSAAGVGPNNVPKILYDGIHIPDDSDKDEDGDGLLNGVEDNPILTSYGFFVHTNRSEKDSDGDSLDDNVELTYKVNVLNYLGTFKTGAYIKGYKYDEFMDNYGQEITADLSCFIMISNPEKVDSDGDGLNDSDDPHPLEFIKSAVYILYCSDFEQQAEYWYRRYSGNNPTFMIRCSTMSNFISAWNAMGLDEFDRIEYNIDKVYMLFHGSVGAFMISYNNWITIPPLSGVYDYPSITELSDKKISQLILNICNSGEEEYSDYGDKPFSTNSGYVYNLAVGFALTQPDITEVIGWDAFYYSMTDGYDFYEWSGKDKFAKLFTMKQTAYVYSRDLNGKIIHSRDYEATLDGADSFWLDVIIH